MGSTAGVGDVRSVLGAQLPGYRVASVVPSGEGLDNVAFEVNGELIVRFSREPDPARRAARAEREARLLAAVAGSSPVPVPVPTFTVAELGCLAYFEIPGVPLVDLPAPPPGHGRSIASTLGELLTALHALPIDRLDGLVEQDDQPLAEWLREAADTWPAITSEVPVAYREAVTAFLDAAPPAAGYTPVFSHNDLGIEHVLVDPDSWVVTGVIDWSDAAIVDPAYDFGLIHRDLGPDALDAALASYRTDRNDVAALRERAVFYARCSVFEDLAYGLGTGQDRYVHKCLAALAWLFPA